MKLQRSLSFVIIGALFAACSQQGEGQRCIRANGDADCESGLVCVAQGDLATESGKTYGADRCCPVDEKRWNDARCERGNSSSNDSGVAGSGNTGNSSAAAGAAAAGAPVAPNGGVSGVAGALTSGDSGLAGAGGAESDNGSAGVAGGLP